MRRIETFDGIAILASNLRDNLDEAFARRFKSIIYFPLERLERRWWQWRQGLSQKVRLDEVIDLETMARDDGLSGRSIMNTIRCASLETLRRGSETITLDEVPQGIWQGTEMELIRMTQFSGNRP